MNSNYGHCKSKTAGEHRRIHSLPLAAGGSAPGAAIQPRGHLLDADRPAQGHRRGAEARLPALVHGSGEPAPSGRQGGERASGTYAPPDSGPARPASPADETPRL